MLHVLQHLVARVKCLHLALRLFQLLLCVIHW